MGTLGGSLRRAVSGRREAIGRPEQCGLGEGSGGLGMERGGWIPWTSADESQRDLLVGWMEKGSLG